MLNRVKKLWRKWVDRDQPMVTPAEARAEFRLMYGSFPIGILTLEGGRWKFRYTEEFRKKKDYRPIVQFPDPVRTYESDELWPFFGLRIPSLKQPSVHAAIERESINEMDKVQLLRRFGRRTIANPFELVSM